MLNIDQLNRRNNNSSGNKHFSLLQAFQKFLVDGEYWRRPPTEFKTFADSKWFSLDNVGQGDHKP